MGEITLRLRRGPGSTRTARPGVAVARRLAREKQYDEAEKIYRACLAADPKDIDAWVGFARMCRGQGRLDEAAYCLGRALRLNPDDGDLLGVLGAIYIRQRDFARAAQAFARFTALAPGDFRAYAIKSAAEREQKLFAQARRTLNEGIERVPFTVSESFKVPVCRVLQLQGLQNAYYELTVPSRGAPGVYLRLGNFTTDHLWNNLDIETITYRLTGASSFAEPALPPFDVIVNAIADPDVEAGSLNKAAEFCARHPDVPLINVPARVLDTSRDGNYRRLKDRPGIVFPKTVRMRRDGGESLAAFLTRHDMRFPLILRVPGTHTGRSVIKADDAAAAEAYLAEAEGDEIYVIEFIERRYRGEFYRKMRVFFIDGEIYPVVHHIDREWNVHGFNRRKVMAVNPWMMDEEKSFVSDPAAFLGPEIYARLRSLYDATRLDFFGVDFTVGDDGRLLIYELNPAMRHSFDHARRFRYLRPSLRRITDAFQAMILKRSRSS